MKRPREPRSKLPTRVPLDDGPRNGTEHWREIDGVRFCHWDRWLLRLALTEPEGLRSIALEFRRRAHGSAVIDQTAEAMLAQVDDLEARLARLGLTPDAVLDDVERASDWLRDKAFRRVWHATSIRETPAMKRTPRNLLRERALRGNWAAFAVSPAPYASEFQAIVGDGWYDEPGTSATVTLLDFTSRRMLRAARSDAARMAVHRALLTVAIEAMEQVDDSFGELAGLFLAHERAYLALLRDRLEAPGMLRDLLELLVWEDYELFSLAEGFLRALPEHHADLAMRDLARIITELRRGNLDYHLDKARTLRQALIAAADALPEDADD